MKRSHLTEGFSLPLDQSHTLPKKLKKNEKARVTAAYHLIPNNTYAVCLPETRQWCEPELQAHRRDGFWITPQIASLDVCEDQANSMVWFSGKTDQAHLVSFTSVASASKQLMSLSPGLWYHLSYKHHRRGELIADQLPKLRPKERNWQSPFPKGPLSIFSLLDENRLIALIDVQPALAPIPIPFIPKPSPPSRAYLKLYEAFYRLQTWPKPNERVLELGSSPGGWTWVLANEAKCFVECIDQGQMDEKLIANPLVEWHKKDAFSYTKQLDWNRYHWILSDMACHPARLGTLLTAALQSNPCLGVVATLKLQNRLSDPGGLYAQFTQLHPAGQLLHLTHNKHELTWLKPPT